MPPRYFLRCLGPPELRSPGGEPIRFRTRKHMALLAFLAVEPRQPHRRERLADLLWPDASPAEGRHSLATALSVIRGKLGPRTFESTRETVRFVAPELEVDLDRLARGNVLGDDLTPPLEMGGFLDDFEVSHAPEFVLWRELRRAHWFPAIRRAFIVLMDRCRRTGDFARIEPLADRLLVLDELSEDAIRAKMEGRAFAGDRMSAIRIFQQWRRKLEEELGATPSPLVEGMALRLRQRGFEPPGTSHIPTVSTDQWRDRAFIGRGSQYLIAYEHWEHTRDSRGRHVLLLGDSGVGKTTLAERLVTAAGLEGAVSSRVQCYEVEREIPYAAIGTLVRGMLDRPGASGTPPEWLGELARTVPAVSQRYHNLPPARESEGEAARLRLTEAVHQLASSIAEEHPLILVVDDVHLADDASVAVLHLLMRRTQEQRIMIVLTGREPELAHSPNASRLKEVRHALALQPVELPPLTEEEMEQVVAALAEAHHRQLSPAVRRALLRASAGIPMIAELLFDDWRTHGEQCLALAIGAMTVDAQGTTAQELYRQIVDRVLLNLSDVARAVLNLAAILGDRLNDLSMYDLVDLTLAQTLAGMSELTTRRILRDGGREMEFRNELLRGYAYLSVPSPHRRALHGLIADRLIAAEAKGKAVPGLTLAWHCYRADRISAAEPYLIRGSKEALNHGACFEAELALKSAMVSVTSVHLSRAKLLLTEALQEQGRWQESLEAIQDGHPWPDENRVAAAALALRARVSCSTDEAELKELVHPTIAIIDEDADLEDKLPAIHSAQLLAWLLQENETLIDRLVALYQVAREPSTKAGLASAILTSAWRSRGIEGLVEAKPKAAAISEECTIAGIENASRFHLENARGCLEASLGSYEAALELGLTAHRLALQLGDDERACTSAINISTYLGRLGRYVEQEQWARKALRLSSHSTRGWRAGLAKFLVAFALAMRGETQRALQESTAGERLLADVPQWMVQADGLLRADILKLCGQDDAAIKQAFLTLTETSLRPLSASYAGTSARWLSRVITKGYFEEEGAAVLTQLYMRVESLDLIDQAEVCAAVRLYREYKDSDSSDCAENVRNRLSRLPVAVSNQLQRFGMFTD